MDAAGAADTVTDSAGHVIGVRRRSRREVMRLLRGWGAAANVDAWVGQAMVAASATSIDGRPLPEPITPDRAEAAADQLGDDGLAAIAAWYEAQGVGADPAEARDAAKN